MYGGTPFFKITELDSHVPQHTGQLILSPVVTFSSLVTFGYCVRGNINAAVTLGLKRNRRDVTA